ncbi:hypothetical protein AB4Y43_16935 [Paraburkholderia sp. BR10872]|uniref:hypothetical protein n=1 Tax=Paraburkholderia sp. BR10872 TaxID=3236989 RepID=UPI0034D26DB9
MPKPYGIELLSGDRAINGLCSADWSGVRALAAGWSLRGRPVERALMVHDEKGMLLRLGGECGWTVPPEPILK